MIYFTSDQHFDHYNIIRYCKRPFDSVEQMNRSLVNNWNSVVTQADLVFVLGDFSMHNADNFISQLNGTKVFLSGNHDRKRGFSSLTVISNSLHLYMQHKPYLDKLPFKTDIFLCGHVHDKWKTRIKDGIPLINVSVDVWDFYPASLEQIKILCKA